MPVKDRFSIGLSTSLRPSGMTMVDANRSRERGRWVVSQGCGKHQARSLIAELMRFDLSWYRCGIGEDKYWLRTFDEASKLLESRNFVVEPDGIEPTTSSMPLSWTYVSDDCHSILGLSKSLVNSQFQRILVF